MKKFLSLVLALVMTMSLVTISAGAKTFEDDSKIQYTEAVEVMKAVKVIDGYADGSFNPSATLTRGAAAKIICNLILGPTTASALKADAAPYKDVPADSTFAGYIAYCQKEGIISGYADGTFRPGNTLTGYAFMKMLLGALGYDKDVEGYEGANWSINVAKRALNLKLTKGLVDDFDGIKPVTREQACLYALNMIQKNMVSYEAKTTVSVGGASVVVAGSSAKEGKPFMTEYFKNLKKTTNDSTTYGRPAVTWTNKNTKIGTYADTPDYVISEATTHKELYDLVGKTVADYTWKGYEDGLAKVVTAPSKTDKVTKYVTDGAVTELYIDDDAKSVIAVVINQYAGEVTKIGKNDDGDRTITIKDLSGSGVKTTKVFKTKDFAVDDIVVFTVSEKEIAEVYTPETAAGKITAVDMTDNADALDTSFVELGDVKYVLNTKFAPEAEPALEKDGTLYLDANGFVVYYKAATEAKQYVYVKTVSNKDAWNVYQAEVVFPDGTSAVVTLGNADYKTTNNGAALGTAYNTDLANYICTYTVGGKNVYYLQKATVASATDGVVVKSDLAVDASNVAIETNSAYFKQGVTNYLTDTKTVFVDVTNGKVYTGYNNVPTYVKDGATEVTAAFLDTSKTPDGVIDLVYIVSYGMIANENSTWVYVANANDFVSKKDADNTVYVVRNVYVDGEKTAMKFANSALANAIGLYKIQQTNDKGYVTKVDATYFNCAGENIVLGEGSFSSAQTQAHNNTSAITYKYWRFDSDTTFVVVSTNANGTKKVEIGSSADMVAYKATMDVNDEYTKVCVVKADKNMAQLVYLFVNEVAANKYALTVADNDSTVKNAAGTALTTGANANALTQQTAYTFTVTPDAGYKVTAVACTETVGGALVTLTANADGSYTIPAEKAVKDLTVTVTTAPIDYTVTTSLTKLTATAPASGKMNVESTGAAATVTLSATAGTRLPDAITVTIGGKAAVLGTDYTYSKTTGEVVLATGKVLGDVVITAAATPVYTITKADPTDVSYTVTWSKGDVLDAGTAGKLTIAPADGKILIAVSVNGEEKAIVNNKVIMNITLTEDIVVDATTVAEPTMRTLTFDVNQVATINCDGETYSIQGGSAEFVDGSVVKFTVSWDAGVEAWNKVVVKDGTTELTAGSGGIYSVTLTADTDITIGAEAYSLALPTGVTATWVNGIGFEAGTFTADTKAVPADATVTISGITGDYFTADAGTTFKANNATISVSGATSVTDTYYKVTCASAVTNGTLVTGNNYAVAKNAIVSFTAAATGNCATTVSTNADGVTSPNASVTEGSTYYVKVTNTTDLTIS